MAETNGWAAWWRRFLRGGDDARSSVLSILCHRYVMEKQNAVRYTEHAKRMQYPQFRDALARMAAEEENHADALAAKITSLGGRLPDVSPIYVGKEQNSWHYIKTDLEEEQRAADDLQAELAVVAAEFPDIAALLEGIARDGKRHRDQLRDMLVRSDPQSIGPP
jgi:rubrerythrin